MRVVVYLPLLISMLLTLAGPRAAKRMPPKAGTRFLLAAGLVCALDAQLALAMLAGGHEMHGRTVFAPLPKGTLACTVTSPVPYDPDGERRDG